jgi:hypothetical protein
VPRTVRNFWLDINVDGKKAGIGTGPRSRDGGFRCRVLMRSNGRILDEELMIDGIVVNGLLKLRVWNGGEIVFTRMTKP